MLLEMAVADAYAIGWEFTDQQLANNDLTGFHQHPTYAELLPGQYTDDTQRAVANAEVLLGWNPGDVFTPLTYAEAYVRAYKRDQREGYSRGFQALLKSVNNGSELLNTVSRTKASNGSVMGVAPLGFIGDVASLKMAATIQAITTHHYSTVVHSQIVALAAHYFIHVKGPQNGLMEYVMDNADWLDKSYDRVTWLGEVADFHHDPHKPTTIRASSISAYMVHAITAYGSLGDIVLDAVNRGGDTDSAAATSVAVASMCKEIENDLPINLVNDMDEANTGFGTAFLYDMEAELRNRYGVTV